MGKIMKIPFYLPFIGIIVSFALILFVAYSPNMTLMITGVILLHLSGLILAAKFFLSFIGFMSTSLN